MPSSEGGNVTCEMPENVKNIFQDSRPIPPCQPNWEPCTKRVIICVFSLESDSNVDRNEASEG